MNFKKLLLVFIIVGSVVALPFISRAVLGTNAKEVNVSIMSQRVISPSILASGFLAHEEEVLLSSEIIGKVSELFIEEGDKVTEGQLVLRVDDKNLLAGLEQSEAAVRLNSIDIERQEVRISNLRRQFERTKQLHERRMVGDDEFESVSNQLDLAEIDLDSSRERLLQAKAQLDQVNDQLSKTQIVSPINGVITSLDIKVGETAIASSTNIPGSSLMTIANPASIYTEVLVDEADVATIAVGQRAEIVAIAYPDQPMIGEVRYIANTAKIAPGRQGLSFTVKIDIIDAGQVVLRPGMSCRAEIFTRQDQEVSAVPIQAIIFEEDRSELVSEYYIFVNDDGVARKTKVDVGLSDDEYQELTSGIDGDIEIVIGPNQELRHLLEGDRLDATRVEL
ncbi:MAG: efflux RND transporter periplasmic adaptor subunit [Gammaproteobacteria bacterium]|jgi:HlyD family secretion protein|nr:efflux RND transporter periplasmic adaptor subunit [Gammaproteobacteria bacterium]MDP7455010.1 efflux RND transporter periplasmic adaptor subunit [Gammaproteobacteria bacterium]|tara:strand:+ start:3508 stop:4686 length:1179 start_codon:yes stop_codon:yes gene_type:complete